MSRSSHPTQAAPAVPTGHERLVLGRTEVGTAKAVEHCRSLATWSEEQFAFLEQFFWFASIDLIGVLGHHLTKNSSGVCYSGLYQFASGVCVDLRA